MTENKLIGLVAAPYTPFNKNGDLTLDTIDKYADHLHENNISGVFVCGTTGESLSLTTDERKLVLEKWVSASQGRFKVICHVGGNCLAECIELAMHAQEKGAYAVGCMAPTFFKPTNVKDLGAFLKQIALSAPEIPFYYYQFPALTGVDIRASEVLKFASSSIPNFGGVKFTHSDFYDMQKCLAFEGGRYNILHGFDEMLLCGLSLGARAAVGSTYNFLAPVYLGVWEAFTAGDMARARDLQQFSVKVVDILVKYRGSTVAGKSIMGMIGIDCGPCRLPLNTLTESEKAQMKDDLTLIGFFEKAGIKI
ncbi:MAG: dihydrodipicolinate synthase family protein [Bacteroidales bacterium]|jgi:N-acetylneuraminate lyase|nr:dihydrodipicolinate synthase family protein [Bacteroidales bacterium]